MRALDTILKETIRALKINPIMASAACPHDRKKKGEEKVKALHFRNTTSRCKGTEFVLFWTLSTSRKTTEYDLGQRRCEPNEGFDVTPQELLKVSSNPAHIINEDRKTSYFL